MQKYIDSIIYDPKYLFPNSSDMNIDPFIFISLNKKVQLPLPSLENLSLLLLVPLWKQVAPFSFFV